MRVAPVNMALEGFKTMCQKDYDEMMQAAQKVGVLIGEIPNIASRFECTEVIVDKSKKLEDALLSIELELYENVPMQQPEETSKEKCIRQKKEYREYLNRIHKGKRRHGGRAF